MNHYPRHIGDWIRDTAHLSEVEECIYSRMIDQYYSREKPLPIEQPAVCRLVRASTKEARKAVDVVLCEFFELQSDGWHQKRCDSELKRYAEKSAKAAASALVRWGALHIEGNANAHANAFKEHCEGNANQNQEPVASKTISTPIGVEVAGSGEPPPIDDCGSAPKAPKYPPCEHQRVIDLYHERLPACPRVIDWNVTRQGYLRQRWREQAVIGKWQSGADGLNYFARFFDFVGQSKFLTGRTPGRGDKPPFVADLEWLLRPTNFAKVREGKYHGS